jgi:hypothetical protein
VFKSSLNDPRPVGDLKMLEFILLLISSVCLVKAQTSAYENTVNIASGIVLQYSAGTTAVSMALTVPGDVWAGVGFSNSVLMVMKID